MKHRSTIDIEICHLSRADIHTDTDGDVYDIDIMLLEPSVLNLINYAPNQSKISVSAFPHFIYKQLTESFT